MENGQNNYMSAPIKLKPKIIIYPHGQVPQQLQQSVPQSLPVQPVAEPVLEQEVRLATLDDLIRGGWITCIIIENSLGKMKGVAVINGNDMQLTAYGYSFDEVLIKMKEHVLAQRIEL